MLHSTYRYKGQPLQYKVHNRTVECHHSVKVSEYTTKLFSEVQYYLPRAYKQGRGHAPLAHNMTRQNSNQPAEYAKFRLRTLCMLSGVAIQYQFTVQAFCIQGAQKVWKLLFIATFFLFCRVRAMHALLPVYKRLVISTGQ